MYVYRFLNSNDEIIYIGRATNLSNRLSTHNHLPDICYSETVKTEYIKLTNNDESAIYERYYINLLSPKYNIQYKNNSEFSFELPNKTWNLYEGKIENSKNYMLHINKTLPILSFADLGKFIKLLSIGIVNSNLLYSKQSFNSNPMNRKQVKEILEFVCVNSADKYICKLKELGVLYNVTHNGKKYLAVNPMYISADTYF